MRFVYLAALALPVCLPASDFFEQKIRPVLAEKCYACHGAKTAMAGLRLDTKAGWQKGGSRGVAIIPGDPAQSLLIRAVAHTDSTIRMPPGGKLSDAEIAALTVWVRDGAIDPRTGTPAPSSASNHWSFQPVRRSSVPNVRNRAWPSTPIDNFLLAAMESKGLAPASPAGKRELLRRVTFDLTGLPPTPQDLTAFLADNAPDAYRRVVDRLLASPHYGERWGRHWLDLARYAETSGHEFDSEKPDAWRYRDYVIRAFNNDLPYDQFLREQIAGDLLPPRYNADGSLHESTLGGGFFAMHEERNAADDLAEVRMEKTDNQIDVLGKTFLGLTVACARCHDHKFDPIPTADYYSLAGIMHSTRQRERNLDTEPTRRRTAEIAAAIAQRNQHLQQHSTKREAPLDDALWRPAIEAAGSDPSNLLYPIARLAKPDAKPFPERLAELRAQLESGAAEYSKRGDIVFADFGSGSYDGWQIDGPAFGTEPTQSQFNIFNYRGGPLASSIGTGSKAFTGVMTSKTFTVSKPYLHVRMAGTLDKSRKREHGVLRFTLQIAGRPAYLNPEKEDTFEWRTTGLRLHLNQPAYFVIADRAPDGYIAVEKIVLSDHSDPPRFDQPPDPRILAILKDPAIDTYAKLLVAYQTLHLTLTDPAASNEELKALEAQLPSSSYGLSSEEDSPCDANIFIRGNPSTPGDTVPRRFLRVLSKSDQPYTQGSGRLQLADAIASPDNPLTARVFVNRVWKHHFGSGLVRSLDNFGATGDRPSHPELLDYLAHTFATTGWRVKDLHRAIVLSSAYRMSSQPSTKAQQIDPENRMLQHMPVRRMEAEAIRDAMLTVAGTLNPAVYGPSVKPHISPYQDGRGKPATGPLDGDGRRSLYIQVRRNFLTPLLLAFDYPLPATTIGNRGATTVPSQALMMMNNEFVNQQAAKWASRMIREFTDPRERIQRMFVEAYSRPPAAGEVAASEAFLKDQGASHGVSPNDALPWTDLAHVLFNSKEFIFVR